MFIKVNDAGSSGLPLRTTRRIPAADLLQTYNTAASQIEAMRDSDKIERQIDLEERKNNREWQKEGRERTGAQRKTSESREKIRLTEAKERWEVLRLCETF
ncbi:hypothetical protein RvY_05457 [Ramazzottius varieornatus]|uniref:Uncharacterized protein n=1 Tax=Ramazzottius varieornatus TaxID=947166 RepID=A0A1D1UVN7_RAMVA|nr:hypothetical protein RvY_05457 [Ramazzottius varieornatus]